jgi:hypothetical protein
MVEQFRWILLQLPVAVAVDGTLVEAVEPEALGLLHHRVLQVILMRSLLGLEAPQVTI